MTAENEEEGLCVVEKSKDVDDSGLSKFSKRRSKDFRKGKKQGLKHTKFKYEYEQC